MIVVHVGRVEFQIVKSSSQGRYRDRTSSRPRPLRPRSAKDGSLYGRNNFFFFSDSQHRGVLATERGLEDELHGEEMIRGADRYSDRSRRRPNRVSKHTRNNNNNYYNNYNNNNNNNRFFANVRRNLTFLHDDTSHESADGEECDGVRFPRTIEIKSQAEPRHQGRS